MRKIEVIFLNFYKKRDNIPFAGGVRGTGAGYGAKGTGIAF